MNCIISPFYEDRKLAISAGLVVMTVEIKIVVVTVHMR